MKNELPVLYCENQRAWEDWLSVHHGTSPGVRLQIAKKGAGRPSVTYKEALESSLCYGWIDSRKEALDDEFWLQRFTPRGAKSIWSKVNKEKAEELIASGRMKPSGLEAIEAAKRNGQWDNAYESQSRAELPEELERGLLGSPKAKAFFDTLDSANRYAMIFRVKTAKKPETRRRKAEQYIRMLENGEKIYP